MTGRQGRRRKQILDDLRGNRRYYELKEEGISCSSLGTGF